MHQGLCNTDGDGDDGVNPLRRACCNNNQQVKQLKDRACYGGDGVFSAHKPRLATQRVCYRVLNFVGHCCCAPFF